MPELTSIWQVAKTSLYFNTTMFSIDKSDMFHFGINKIYSLNVTCL